MIYDCVVVGGGISGLGAAYALHKREAALLVVEAGATLGGAIQSERSAEGFVLEHGPNTVVSSDAGLLGTFAELGIASERVVAGGQGSKRYILHRGVPTPLPSSPLGLLTTPLLSRGAKLRLLAEPLVPRAHTSDESVYSFFTRRLGAEPARRFVDPFVSGIYAGDPASLSLGAAFPRLWRAEQRAGSLLLGMLLGAGRDPHAPRPSGKRALFSFRNGLHTWPAAVGRALGPEQVWLRSRVVALAPDADGWRLTVEREQNNHGTRKVVEVRATSVVLAVPAYVAAALVASLDAPAATALRGIHYPPLAVVHLGWRQEDLAHPLDGFGMLCPEEEQRRILGSLWPSTLFSGRAPQGMVLLTQFVGGGRAPELAQHPDEAIIADVASELRALLGAHGEPVAARVVRWPCAIPQYNAGHAQRIATIERLEARYAGLHLLGNYRGGVAVPQCWANGQALGERLVLAGYAMAGQLPT
jgi:protoporphyrinogen/coproporphyrinogen III oxidase